MIKIMMMINSLGIISYDDDLLISVFNVVW